MHQIHFTGRSFSGYLFGIFLTTFGWGQDLSAIQDSKEKNYDIEITRISTTPCSEDGFGLNLSNFLVSQSGKPINIRISQPVNGKSRGYWETERHLLLVLPHGATLPDYSKILPFLSKALDAGWGVSILRPDGTSTPYEINMAAMEQDFAVKDIKPISMPAWQTALEVATNQLSWFPGRRVLVVAPTRPKNPVFSNWINRQKQIFPMLYLVDGGFPIYVDNIDLPDPSSLFSGQRMPGAEHKRGYASGYYHAVNFQEAINDVLVDAHCDFDLQFAIPPSGQSTESPIQLTLHNAAPLLALHAEMYEMNSAPRNTPSLRKPARQRLILKEH